MDQEENNFIDLVFNPEPPPQLHPPPPPQPLPPLPEELPPPLEIPANILPQNTILREIPPLPMVRAGSVTFWFSRIIQPRDLLAMTITEENHIDRIHRFLDFVNRPVLTSEEILWGTIAFPREVSADIFHSSSEGESTEILLRFNVDRSITFRGNGWSQVIQGGHPFSQYISMWVLVGALGKIIVIIQVRDITLPENPLDSNPQLRSAFQNLLPHVRAQAPPRCLFRRRLEINDIYFMRINNNEMHHLQSYLVESNRPLNSSMEYGYIVNSTTGLTRTTEFLYEDMSLLLFGEAWQQMVQGSRPMAQDVIVWALVTLSGHIILVFGFQNMQHQPLLVPAEIPEFPVNSLNHLHQFQLRVNHHFWFSRAISLEDHNIISAPEGALELLNWFLVHRAGRQVAGHYEIAWAVNEANGTETVLRMVVGGVNPNSIMFTEGWADLVASRVNHEHNEVSMWLLYSDNNTIIVMVQFAALAAEEMMVHN